MNDLIAESLEMLSESEADIYGRVYEHFFRINPDAEELMTHMDELTRGRMLEEVTRLLMVNDLGTESAYVEFEYNNHKAAYNVQSRMYRQLFDAFVIAVKESVGDAWRSEFEEAWMSRVKELEQAFDLR
ncbi:globin [Gammaproteobacteria bacterium]|jgi:hemoglobin-like flavoprotein|nr:globin [Gammaproteobacteria bacterium]